MDFQLNEDQLALVNAVQGVLQDHAALPQSERLGFSWFDAPLQRKLADNGFLDAARTLGNLEAALVAIETARVPATVEAATSGLVAPNVLPDESIAGPVAVVNGSRLHVAVRNLPVARTALVELGGDVAVLPVDPAHVEPVETILAYPYGHFRQPPDLATARIVRGAGDKLRQWSRVALAAEFAGAAASATAFTVDYVKQRQVFGHAVGAFQAVQHRLVQCHQIAEGVHFLALQAAWSGDPCHADLAACFAQQHVQKLLFDLHQFNGAMGVTNEHLLHFWTYRLRALQSEAGGTFAAALGVADRLWGKP